MSSCGKRVTYNFIIFFMIRYWR